MDKPGLIIAIDKPAGWTSFQVVNKLKWHIRRTFGIKKLKIGHAGTLDPLASGLLLVCVGSATKQIESLQSGIKAYTGTMVLGATTPCFDLEQTVDHRYPYTHITYQQIERARLSLVGPQEQVPPMFSAVKVDGRRAYVSARDGAEVEIAPKHITVYDFQITAYREGHGDNTGHAGSAPTAPAEAPRCGEPLDVQATQSAAARQASQTEVTTVEPRPTAKRELYRDPQGIVPPELPQIDFYITCSKGTYIRSLARDMGLALNSGAFLSDLRRHSIGDYSLSEAIKIDDIEKVITADNPTYAILHTL